MLRLSLGCFLSFLCGFVFVVAFSLRSVDSRAYGLTQVLEPSPLCGFLASPRG